MYCNHCGAELPDGSKFCQDCGTVTKAAAAEQKAKKKAETPPPTPTPPSSDTKKSSNKKVNPLLIAIIIVVIAAVGSLVGKFAIAPSLSDSEGDTNTTSNILGTNEAPEPGIDNDYLNGLTTFSYDNDVTYRDVGALDYDILSQRRTSWTYKYDNDNFMTVVADYSTKNNYVSHISFTEEINKNYPKYYQNKQSLETYETMFQTLNDPSASPYDYIEYSNGDLMFYGHTYDLCAGDRADRVILMSTILGVPYDTTNNSFSVTDLRSTLTDAGFVEQ